MTNYSLLSLSTPSYNQQHWIFGPNRSVLVSNHQQYADQPRAKVLVTMDQDQHLMDWIRLLSSTERQVIDLCYSQRVSIADAAQQLGLPKSEVSRIMKSVSKRLKHNKHRPTAEVSWITPEEAEARMKLLDSKIVSKISGRLTYVQRRILNQYFDEGRSTQEIARFLDQPESYVLYVYQCILERIEDCGRPGN